MTRAREEIEKIVNDLEYELLDEYSDNKYNRRVIIQDRVGYKYDVYLYDLERNHVPNFVSKSNSFTLINISLWLSLNRPEFKLCEDNDYIGSKEKLKFYHSICNDYFYLSWNDLYNEHGCGICRGFQVGRYNSLSYLYPDIAKQWHPDNKISSDEVTCGSAKKAYWICPDCGYGKNKEWFSSISSRTSGNNCPVCYGTKIVSDKNRLSILYPKIASEWNYGKNEETPEDVSYASNKKRWWICSHGHESYLSNIADRTRGRGCPKCNFSKGENEIESWIKNNFQRLKDVGIDYCQPQAKIEDCRNKKPLPYDFGLHFTDDSWSMIEYYGEQHFFSVDFANNGEEWAKREFEENKKMDEIKQKYCRENNIPLLIIPYWQKENINEILENWYLT